MRFPQSAARIATGIGIVLAVSVAAQQLTPGQSADPTMAVPNGPQALEVNPVHSDPRTYRDVDLLRRDGFSVAEQATVSLRLFDKKGVTPAGLQSSDFSLVVNGTPRDAKLQAPGDSAAKVSPMVLIVFPPNQPTIHSIGVRQSERYFSSLPDELLPWKVGILDSNGKLTPFTDGRSQLLAYLDAVDHTNEPFEYWTDAGLRSNTKWDGGWLTNAEEAIALMQNFSGPKVILAMNPLAESMYGLNDQILSHNGPESLTQIARHIGAHIYIANVGGPEVAVPGGDAAEDRPAQVNGVGGPLLGSRPSDHMQIDPRLSAQLDYFAYRNSVMMMTAKDTLGGFSNSLKDLAGYIHRDLDENYSLTFEMTPRDRDTGIPNVEVRMADHQHKVAILDVTPVGSTLNTDRMTISKEVQDRVKRESRHPVSSPDFKITQRVDSFPLRGGLQPILPMSAVVEWTGQGRSPRRLAVVETVEETNLSSTILDRDVQVKWNGRSLSWERDGILHPGRYLWRVAVHDEQGKVYVAAERRIEIDFPRGAAVSASSLVVGKSCRSGGTGTGLRKRADVDPNEKEEQQHMQVDPMQAADCRLKPEPTDRFAATESLHALVRIYPAEKLAKRTAENWTASFVLRSASGAVEAEKEIPFANDAESGYLAYVEVPLDAEAIRPGAHTLDVSMKGPGIRGSLKESREIEIAAAR